eukprot:scaffold2362_cov85-Phaeocystis_antarctica.AAC.2
MEADDDAPMSSDAPAAIQAAWATASASSKPESTQGNTQARRAAARSQARAAVLPRRRRYTPDSKAFPSGEGQG